MSLASAAGALLRPQTPLQQLLEDINFQRNKEMRQLLKDGMYGCYKKYYLWFNKFYFLAEKNNFKDFFFYCFTLSIICNSCSFSINIHPLFCFLWKFPFLFSIYVPFNPLSRFPQVFYSHILVSHFPINFQGLLLSAAAFNRGFCFDYDYLLVFVVINEFVNFHMGREREGCYSLRLLF